MASAKGALSGAGSGVAAGSAGGPWGALAGGVIGGLSGLFGGDEGVDTEELYARYLDQLQGISIPALDELIAAGVIEGTAYEDIAEDPATRQASMDAINALLEEGRTGGASVQSKAVQEALLDRTRQEANSQRQAVMEEMARRGQLGGGAELVSKNMANQAAAQREHLGGVQMAADDRARALNSLVQAGQMGSTVRGQDLAKSTNLAEAKDKLAQWNAENKLNAYGNRTSWQLAKAGATAPAVAGMASASANKTNQTVNTGSALGSLAGGAAGYLAGSGKTYKGTDQYGNPIYE